MSSLEDFELALARAQAAIAGLRRAPPGASSERADAGTAAHPVRDAAPTPSAPAAVAADKPARSLLPKAALIALCLGVAFLQYYYIDVALEIFSMPAVFRASPR